MDERPGGKDSVRKAKIPLRRDMVVPIIPQDVFSYGCHHMLFLTKYPPKYKFQESGTLHESRTLHERTRYHFGNVISCHVNLRMTMSYQSHNLEMSGSSIFQITPNACP